MRTIENKFIRLLVALIAPIVVIGYAYLMTEYPELASIVAAILSMIVLTFIIYQFFTP